MLVGIQIFLRVCLRATLGLRIVSLFVRFTLGGDSVQWLLCLGEIDGLSMGGTVYDRFLFWDCFLGFAMDRVRCFQYASCNFYLSRVFLFVLFPFC